MTRQKATLIGLIAIVLWSTMVGLIRGVSEGLGPVGGAAAIYSLSGLLLIFTLDFRVFGKSRKAIYSPGVCYSSAMKSVWRFP